MWKRFQFYLYLHQHLFSLSIGFALFYVMAKLRHIFLCRLPFCVWAAECRTASAAKKGCAKIGKGVWMPKSRKTARNETLRAVCLLVWVWDPTLSNHTFWLWNGAQTWTSRIPPLPAGASASMTPRLNQAAPPTARSSASGPAQKGFTSRTCSPQRAAWAGPRPYNGVNWKLNEPKAQSLGNLWTNSSYSVPTRYTAVFCAWLRRFQRKKAINSLLFFSIFPQRADCPYLRLLRVFARRLQGRINWHKRT